MLVSEALDLFRRDRALYYKTCLKIANKNRRIVPFNLNPAQQILEDRAEAMRRAGKPPRLIVLKARQMGISTWAQANLFHRCHVYDNQQALVLAHVVTSAAALFRMSQLFYRMLPETLRPKKKADNKREMHFEKNNSRLQVEVASGGAARGFTASQVHLSEYAFYNDPEDVFAAVMNAVPLTTDSLVVVESTPNGVGNHFHDLWVSARSGASDFEPVFLPWFVDPQARMPARFTLEDLDTRERELVDKHHLTVEQLAWRRYKIANDLAGDVEKFDQECPDDDHRCFLSSGRRVFPMGDIAPHRDALPPATEYDKKLPPRMEIQWLDAEEKPLLEAVERGRFRIYAPPKPRVLYTAGIDPSSGDGPALPRPGDNGSDPCPILVLNRMTMGVDALWWGRTPPDNLAVVARAVGLYYNKALLNPEVNNHGLTTISKLEEIYPNIYYRVDPADSAKKAVQPKLGYETTGRTRDYLINNVRTYLRLRLGKIPDPQIIAELEWMVYVPNVAGTKEKADHPRGKTSDCVIALGLALEAHKAYPEAPLIPLTIEEVQAAKQEFERLVEAGEERAARESLDRFNVTADDLAKFDELVCDRRKRVREASPEMT